VKSEPVVRLAAFFAVFAIFAIAEALAPRRVREFSRAARWPANLGVALIYSILISLIIPAGITGFALYCTAHRWGLLNLIHLPRFAMIALSILALDLIIYLQHVLFHAIPALWRLHRMHHADLDFDVTTGVRFHPLEMIISTAVKLGAVAILGAPAIAVLAFELLLNATSLFNHANLAVPPPLDALVRLIVVTPDMHRVHHSIVVRETNSNFGFNLPWWDRMLGTYRAQPEAGHLAMTIGLDDFRTPADLRLLRMIAQPWHVAALKGVRRVT
jgi:sterol desaturase/sphingolipid hydroxylase (fatty acid hydroxylase superfamily)